jgi:hypothetical protein
MADLAFKSITIKGITYSFANVAIVRPQFCKIVMLRKCTGILAEFQQYLLSLGRKIEADPMALKQESKIIKKSTLDHEGTLTSGKYKGQSFSYVYEIDYSYCYSILKKSDPKMREFKNWLTRAGVKLEKGPNPYQREENKYKLSKR